MRIEKGLMALPRHVKVACLVALDAGLCCISVAAAFYLRLDTVPIDAPPFALVVWGVLAISLPVLGAVGVYRSITRHSGWPTMLLILKGLLVASLPIVAVVTMVGVPGVPRTVGVLQPIVLLLLLILSRAVMRFALAGASGGAFRNRHAARVVIYGAGSAGRQLFLALAAPSSGMIVEAYIDDDARLRGRTLDGVPVRAPGDLPNLIDRGIRDVLLAIPSATRRRRSEILTFLRDAAIHVQTLPALADLATGKVRLDDLREPDIQDLLGRDPVAPSSILLGRTIVGRVVLVTGAGGSIGSELCRQIAAVGPVALILVDTSEFALYSINEELSAFPQVVDGTLNVVPLLASVSDESLFKSLLDTWRPDTVYHAAAYKHVPLVEQNVVQGVRNNALGTAIASRASQAAGVKDFVLISTDKAVRPTNVMGASKRLAELILQALANEQSGTRFSIVRFGNVLGSSGSVVPLFRRQIRDGGPVTLTHPEMTRYFMTIPEAAQLVLQAAAMASGGDVFVLDMGDPVRIADLARNMIELSGLTVRDEVNPDGDIEIKISGLRPGEKLFEELLIGNNPESTRHPRIMRAREDWMPWTELSRVLESISGAIARRDAELLRRLLQTHVDGYQPIRLLADLASNERMIA